MAERIPEFQTVRVEDRKTVEEANLALPLERKELPAKHFPKTVRTSRFHKHLHATT
jgi:hypothetical protein